ncbi:MAG TPA: tetratricopeptide repeat protein [Thermodesulfovibrionales bacterium]|nr:tetratricopeptide repeat protein [Thermodesulfovibrionales bacterium]
MSEKFHAALTCYQNGDLPEAMKICREITDAAPDNTDALILLGLIEQQRQELGAAETHFERAIESEPNNSYAFFCLGNVSLESGNLDKALESFEKAVNIDPSFGDAYYNLAIVREKRHEFEEALSSYKKALSLNPGLADVHNNIGNLLLKMRNFDEAESYLRGALDINPSYPRALSNLGMALKGQGRYDEATMCFQRAIDSDPSFAEPCLNLAILMRERGDPLGAIKHLRMAVARDPSCADAYYNLGIIMKEDGALAEAENNLEKAVEIDPSCADAYSALAAIYEESGLTDKALSYYQKALSAVPEDPETHWNMSLALLSVGNFEKGWREYEWRSEIKDFETPYYPIPRWDGSFLKGGNLLIHGEQGIGEEIMFASCLPDAIERAAQCVVKCDKRLVPIFARSFPGAHIIGRSTPDNTVRDTQTMSMKIAMGSLPFFFRQTLSRFPQSKSYLVPDSSKVALWQGRFKELGPGLKVGISWRGGSKASEKLLRSTNLDQWQTLLSIPGAHFINLQYGDCSQELKKAKEELGATIHHWEDADPLKDLDGFAAQIAALDLVISVDNATVHMAGAVGILTWALIPFVCDWRWMRNFEDTPWYKTVRLFRQSSAADWGPVFESLVANLGHCTSSSALYEIAPEHSYKSAIKNIPSSPTIPVPFFTASKAGARRCAIVTPVGPGHNGLYSECLESVKKSFSGARGIFSEIIPIRIDDSNGRLGRSSARNIGVKKAAQQNADWIFFLDADDIMAPSAFEYVSGYLEHFDAVWGSIWTIERGEVYASERPHQLPFLYGIEELLLYDPFLTLQMGHFVKTSVALATPFDESIDIGEDFDYYLRVWERHPCIKIPLPFFYNRRGLHSSGPRSAGGYRWNQQVGKIIKTYCDAYRYCAGRKDGSDIRI